MANEYKENKKRQNLRLTNGIRSGGDKRRLQSSVRLGHYVPTPHYTHIFTVAGNLRFP